VLGNDGDIEIAAGIRRYSFAVMQIGNMPERGMHRLLVSCLNPDPKLERAASLGRQTCPCPCLHFLILFLRAVALGSEDRSNPK
jgi:hypothetical protein